MKKNNAKFRTNPESFIKSKGISYPGVIRNSNLQGGFKGIIDHTAMEFDLVPTKIGNIVDLVLLGALGSYGQTSRKGAPIVGHFLHWNGQSFKSGSDSFGSLDLSSCRGDYVFTPPFTGCHFVFTRSLAGNLKVYHEPTEDGVCVYPDPVIARVGPEYEDGKVYGGNGILCRNGSGWKAIITSIVAFGGGTTVATFDID